MKKTALALLTLSLILFLTASSMGKPGHYISLQESSSADTLQESILPEGLEQTLEEIISALPSKSKKSKAKSSDPMLAKSGNWYTFYYYLHSSYAQNDWRKLAEPQLFLADQNQIVGHVYISRDRATPKGPSCTVVKYENNARLKNVVGTAYECLSGEIYYFFYNEGVSYLVIYADRQGSSYVMYADQ